MKKLLIVGATAALLLTVGATAFAANGVADNTAVNSARPQYCVYADANNDGVCDNWDAHHQNNSAYCPNRNNNIQNANNGCTMQQNNHHGQNAHHGNGQGHHGYHGGQNR